jgi:hypothetical protein
MEMGIAREVVASVPLEWDVAAATREKWAYVICERAKKVAEFIVPRLVADGGLGF